MSWILFACGSALFAGMTAILAKIGIRKTDSGVATAIRTVIVLLMSCLMVTLVGSWPTLPDIAPLTWLFLVLSGLATGASWLCYFEALSIGDVDRVVPVDKSSIVLTVLGAMLFLGEGITWSRGIALALIAAGTYLMIEKKGEKKHSGKGFGWLGYALLSAVFAALTSLLGKVGITGVESNLGTAIRTAVVLVMAWGMVFLRGKGGEVKKIPAKDFLFICLSGIATGFSWLCYYRALKDGPASVVVPIDKLSILVTVAFSYFVFGEKLSRKSGVGLVLIVAGTLLMLV